MDQRLNELEQYLQAVIKDYPPLPAATNIEEKLDKAVAFREILTDYNVRAKIKIQQLFANDKVDQHKQQIHQIAVACLHSYHKQ